MTDTKTNWKIYFMKPLSGLKAEGNMLRWRLEPKFIQENFYWKMKKGFVIFLNKFWQESEKQQSS